MHSFHAGTKPSHYYGTTTFNEKNIDWLALSKEESSSLMSYLYYMQNP